MRLRPDAAPRFGLTPGDVRRAATTLVKGTKVGEVYEEQKIFDVVVWGAPNACARTSPRSRGLPDRHARAAAQVPLGDVADVTIAPDAERDQARERRRAAST